MAVDMVCLLMALIVAWSHQGIPARRPSLTGIGSRHAYRRLSLCERAFFRGAKDDDHPRGRPVGEPPAGLTLGLGGVTVMPPLAERVPLADGVPPAPAGFSTPRGRPAAPNRLRSRPPPAVSSPVQVSGSRSSSGATIPCWPEGGSTFRGRPDRLSADALESASPFSGRRFFVASFFFFVLDPASGESSSANGSLLFDLAETLASAARGSRPVSSFAVDDFFGNGFEGPAPAGFLRISACAGTLAASRTQTTNTVFSGIAIRCLTIRILQSRSRLPGGDRKRTSLLQVNSRAPRHELRLSARLLLFSAAPPVTTRQVGPTAMRCGGTVSGYKHPEGSPKSAIHVD